MRGSSASRFDLFGLGFGVFSSLELEILGHTLDIRYSEGF
jgi:hypothetical protein